jgi:hypothetical protein
MNNPNILGIHGEGRIPCQGCAERLYGNSLEMYLSAGEIHGFSESDRLTYASKGLLCDECFSWIFPPDKIEDPWWSQDPDPEEHLRLLAPFADFLETLNVDTMNLRNNNPSL